MESVFVRFDSYDFEADHRFQEGLKSLEEGSSRDENKLLDMKLFFYNRYETSVGLKMSIRYCVFFLLSRMNLL